MMERLFWRRLGGAVLVGSAALAVAPSANAFQGILNTWRTIYPASSSDDNAATGDGDSRGCTLCHSAASTGEWNAYGSALEVEINVNGLSVEDAIAAVEPDDSDEDPTGSSNLTEIDSDTQPGWTEGNNNTIYDADGVPIRTNQPPPNFTSGMLDPPADNNPPVVEAVPDQVDDENQAVNLQVNASDADMGDTLTYSAMGLPTGLTINSGTGLISGSLSFDAVIHPNLTQVFNVTVNVSDGMDTTPMRFQWTVNDVNRAPVAVTDSASTLQDQPVVVDVQANDSDADGDALTTLAVTTPASGTVAITGGDTVTYTPNGGFVGSDSFDYTIDDGFGGTATTSVTVTVSDVNDPPNVTNPGPQAILENESVNLQVTASDPDGDALTYSATNLPPDLSIDSSTGLISGTVLFDAVVHPAIQDIYAVAIDVSDGLDTTTVNFDWTVTDVNRDPVAIDDDAAAVHDTSVTVDVLANDSDADGDALTVSGVTMPASGTLTVNPDNTVTYTPNVAFVGTDSFAYTSDDGFGGNATATVTVEVTNRAPLAVDDVYATQQDTALVVGAPGILTNDADADGDPLIAVPGAAPANGLLQLNEDGSFEYTADPGFIGSDTFTYFATDGIVGSNEATVTINVTEINLPPVVQNPGPQTNDEGDSVSLQIVTSDPNGDVLGYTATGLPPGLSIGASSGLIVGTVSFDAVIHPDPSSVFPVTVAVSDGTNPSGTVNFDWTVNDVNREPTVVDDAATTQVDTPVTVDVLTNDSDADGDALTLVSTGVPPNGATVINPDGTVTYTPATGFTGTDAFDYTIEDGFGGSATATATITVDPAPPVDLDIAQLKVTKRVRLANVKAIGIQLTVKNNGTIEGSAPATIVGMQNGIAVYEETRTVADPVGNGRTKINFTVFTPTDAGDIVWTATIADGEPDVDEVTATTVVR